MIIFVCNHKVESQFAMGCCREESEEVSKHDHILSRGFDQHGGTPLDRSPQKELHLVQGSIAEK